MSCDKNAEPTFDELKSGDKVDLANNNIKKYFSISFSHNEKKSKDGLFTAIECTMSTSGYGVLSYYSCSTSVVVSYSCLNDVGNYITEQLTFSLTMDMNGKSSGKNSRIFSYRNIKDVKYDFANSSGYIVKK